MLQVNNNYLKLPGQYLFSEIARRVECFKTQHPDIPLISLGIGDVTQPLAPAVIEAMQRAVAEQADVASFHGYGPEQGYAFLREAIVTGHYARYNVRVAADEIFVGDGAKSDLGNIGEIFAADARVAVCDPVYPVYLDTNAMAGRAGIYSPDGRWDKLLYLPCTEDNGFCPDPPGPHDPVPELIYLCFPNNPTGSVISANQLRAWVDYANDHGSVILYDAAYEAYMTQDYPHSIFEIAGARTCAIEFCSFSKLAGFTGIRLGFTVIPRELNVQGTCIRELWQRRQATKFNGASYIAQRAGEAVYSDEGYRQVQQSIAAYMANAVLIRTGLKELGLSVYGGVNAPYIWLKTPDQMDSWAYFDHLLQHAQVVGTPGSGFGPCGEGYFRLTAFGSQTGTVEAMKRIRKLYGAC